MISQDLPWAAGLFEGEGCLSINHLAVSDYPSVWLRMTDEDVVRHFAETIGFGAIYGPRHDGNPRHKPCWIWTARGVEKTQALIAMLWPWLGSRRRSRAREVLAATQ
jgi:hypothetical protein